MSDASAREKPAPIPYPLHSVLGIVDQPSGVEAVVTRLADAGVPAESVEVVCGAQARQRLDAFRQQHGLKAHLARIVQSLSDERPIADRYEEALRADRFLVIAPAADGEQGQEVGEVIRDTGGHFVNYYGPNTITTIAP